MNELGTWLTVPHGLRNKKLDGDVWNIYNYWSTSGRDFFQGTRFGTTHVDHACIFVVNVSTTKEEGQGDYESMIGENVLVFLQFWMGHGGFCA